MQAYELNKHGKIVFPSNCFPDLDFSTFESLDQLDAVVRRDFDSKAPTGTDILEQIKTGAYQSKFDLMRDMALNLFWANRFKITMYDVRPTRWADVPRSRDDVFVPILTPWEDSETKVAAVLSAYPNLAAQWDAEVEDSIFEILFDVFGHRRNHATKLSPVIPTVADLLSDPGNQTLRLNRYDPDFRRYSYAEIIDCDEDVAELEALRRWSMVLHNQYPWARSEAALVAVEKLRENDYVVVFYPRNPEVQHFLSRVASGPAPKTAHPVVPVAVRARSPVPGARRAQRLGGAASYRGHLRSARRSGVYQRGHHPQQRLQLVAHVCGRHPCQDRHRAASIHLGQPRGPLVASRPVGAGSRSGGSRSDRSGDRVHLHQLPADAVGRHLAVRRAGHPADALLLRPRRRLRRLQLRAGRGHENPPTGSASCARWSARRSSPTRSGTSGHPG